MLLPHTRPGRFRDFFGLLQPSQGTKVTIPDDLLGALRDRKSTHLLVFTRHRDDADLRFVNGTGSTGQLEGLGYYVDHVTRVLLIRGQSSWRWLPRIVHALPRHPHRPGQFAGGGHSGHPGQHHHAGGRRPVLFDASLGRFDAGAEDDPTA